ncbi:hypothetical protein NHN26_03580 [Rhodovulum tesquicola]|uniref:hypothetical protein n=1 Tax=Rhodovulum tesquicola TaxID=540254 RepID=UPI0020975DEE|nr:hypothetical protein [Rhodovulum tesquicola]MCO8144301.1 hypothetical protein [Rhodovulum tesquicola]
MARLRGWFGAAVAVLLALSLVLATGVRAGERGGVAVFQAAALSAAPALAELSGRGAAGDSGLATFGDVPPGLTPGAATGGVTGCRAIAAVTVAGYLRGARDGANGARAPPGVRG